MKKIKVFTQEAKRVISVIGVMFAVIGIVAALHHTKNPPDICRCPAGFDKLRLFYQLFYLCSLSYAVSEVE